MSLPLPSLGNPLANLGTPLAALGGAMAIGQRTTQAFGDLLSQLKPVGDSGPSEASSLQPSNLQLTSSDAHLSSDNADSYAERLKSMKAKLRNWLDATCKQLGIQRSSQPLDVRLDCEQRLEIAGPEPLRTKLYSHLSDSEELTAELRSLQESQPTSLAWILGLPPRQDTVRSASTIAPKRLDPLLIQL